MKAVGIREFKNRLSEYVRLVRSGERILVTDRGEVVAELGPSGEVNAQEVAYPGLLELVREKRARLGALNHPGLYPKRRVQCEAGTAVKLINEDRGGR